MNRILICAFFLICFTNNYCHAQSQWWTLPNAGLVPPPYGSIRYDDIYFISKDTGCLVSEFGYIYKTYDGGNYWYVKASLGDNVYFRSIEFSDDGQYGIAGTLAGIVLRTTDRGETWTDISSAISDTGAYPRRMCGLSHWGNSFYGVGWWGGPTARFYKSNDNGLTWQTTYFDSIVATGLVDIAFTSQDTCFITGCHLITDSTDLGRESIVLRSTDAGQTWTKVFSDNTLGGRIWKIQFINKEIGVGSIEPGYYPDTVVMIKTTDGGSTWNVIPIGHKYSEYYGTQGIGFLTPLKGWVGGYYYGMFETNDGGITWDSINAGYWCNRYFRIDSTTMYVSGDKVYKYTNFATGVPNVTKPVSGIHLLPVSPNPSRGNIKIEFDLQSQNNMVLEIVSIDSKRIYHVADGYLKAGHYTYYWDGSNAPPGNYMVWLGTDEVPAVQKFVLSP